MLYYIESRLASESEEHVRLAEVGGGWFSLLAYLPLLSVFCQRCGGCPDLVPLRPPGHLPSPGLDHDHPGSQPPGLAGLGGRHWRILSTPGQICGSTTNTDRRLQESEAVRSVEGPECWPPDSPDLLFGPTPGGGGPLLSVCGPHHSPPLHILSSQDFLSHFEEFLSHSSPNYSRFIEDDLVRKSENIFQATLTFHC